MKILHTSDWHLGHSIYGYDRTKEQRRMLEQMVEIVTDEQPDVMVVSGDVFHTAQPSSAAQTMFANALVEIHKACPEMPIVVTAGNHDSGAKLEIFRTPWRALNVFAQGSLDRENPSSHIVEVVGKGYVVAMPYVFERNMPEGFVQNLLDEVDLRNSEGLPVVLMAHTTVVGCDFTGHDRASEATVGGIDSVDIDQLGDGYDYLALGHIHHAQFVHTGMHNVRYSGTPLAVGFDENYPHTVSIIEIAAHGARPEVREVEIDNPHPLVTLPTTGFGTWNDVLQLLRDYPDDIESYIRLNVEVEDYLPTTANAEAEAAVGEKSCRFCHINTHRTDKATAAATEMSVDEFQAEDPLEIARKYAKDTDSAFDDEMQDLFAQVMSQLNQ